MSALQEQSLHLFPSRGAMNRNYNSQFWFWIAVAGLIVVIALALESVR